MKKNSNKGFVLAETIVVAVFMVTIFTVLYSNYFPIMANYEKREYYDDIDSKYIAFWLKYIIQDNAYDFTRVKESIDEKGYAYFNCGDIDLNINSPNYFNNLSKNNSCNRLTKEAGINDAIYTDSGAVDISKNPFYCVNEDGNPCAGEKNIPLKYVAIITNYRLSSFTKGSNPEEEYQWPENFTGFKSLLGNRTNSSGATEGPDTDLLNGLSDGMIDYIFSLPDYTKEPVNKSSRYRLIIELVDTREPEREPIYKYANIEVRK